MRRAIDPRLVLALAPLALAAPTLADDLFVGIPLGTILRADVEEGVFRGAGVCGGPIQSMALVANTIMIGDSNGNVYGLDLDSGGVGYYFTLPGSDNTAIAADHGNVLISELDGTVRRVNPANGAVLNTFTSTIGIQAMVADDTYIYVAGPEGNVHRAPLATGEFSYFACACLGSVNSLALLNGEILAGDEWGNVLRFDLKNGNITGGFNSMGDNSAMTVSPDGELYITDSEGHVRHIDPEFGDILETMDAGMPISAIIFVAAESAECPGDFNGDSTVNSADFFGFLTEFFVLGPKADFNANGTINSSDFFDFVNAFFTPCI